MRKYAMPFLALVGFTIAIAVVIQDDQAAPLLVAPGPMPAPPSSFVEGTGITEASTGNIAIGTPVPGVVAAIDVTWGESSKPMRRCSRSMPAM